MIDTGGFFASLSDRTRQVNLMLVNYSLARADALGLSWRANDLFQAREAIKGGPGARWFLGYRLLLGLTHEEALFVSSFIKDVDGALNDFIDGYFLNGSGESQPVGFLRMSYD